MLLMIDNYDSFTYNLVQYFGELGHRPEVIRNDTLNVSALMALRPTAVVISPGPCSPKEAGVSCAAIRAFAESGVPVLGVCLGMQATIAEFGGIVDRAPYPMHGKVSDIVHQGQSLFAGLPSPFKACRYHSLCGISIPDCLEVTARSADDQVVQGIRHRTLPVHGVQFHPEAILTEHGHAMLANFLKIAGMKS